MLSKVTTKGQVTIPKSIRDALGIGPNDRVAFIQEGERFLLQPIRTLKALRGVIKAKGSSTFSEERSLAKKAVAERVNGESE
ncbi:MAG: AbrB/MazE/SpoVT family DNA-binding domain-containing protein [Syntrophales bacterium]|nr:AbrB/MazE/SpoVT family DNA-binding domain-containing protein [Syntrophales bacterium]